MKPPFVHELLARTHSLVITPTNQRFFKQRAHSNSARQKRLDDQNTTRQRAFHVVINILQMNSHIMDNNKGTVKILNYNFYA